MARYDSVEDLSIRQIQIFISAADLGSFTKAGERLFMTQSMVSKSIAAMEKSVGVRLFTRMPNGIELTPAGRVIYQSWKTLSQGMEQTVATAHAAQDGSVQQILISDFSTSVKKEYLWPYVKRFHERRPDVDIFLDTVAPGQVLERLETNSCDIAFVPAYMLPVFEQKNISYQHVLRCPMCAWIHESNPLYARDSLEVSDLRDETFIVVSPQIIMHYEREILDICRKAGFVPKKILRMPDVGTATLNVKLGKGIVIRDSVFDSAETSDIKMFKLEGTCGGTIMAWRGNLENDCARDFITLYRQGS